MNEKEIAKRWNERIVANGWHEMGSAGATLYLKKYGRNIGPEKIAALCDKAKMEGYPKFARGLRIGTGF